MIKKFSRIAAALGIALGVMLGTAGVAFAAAYVVGVGGTGWTNIQANTILLGNGTGQLATTTQGTNGQVLSLVNGVPSWVATTSINNGVSSLAVTPGGVAQTGAVTLATTSTASNGLTPAIKITNVGGAFNLSSTLAGTLTVSGGGTGKTTFTASQLLYGNGAVAIAQVATTTFGATNATLTVTGTAGALVGGTNSTIALNLANPNTWTGLQTFGNSSTTAASFGYASSTNAFFGTLNLPGITGTQCLHVVSGVVSGTGADCGTGTGSGITSLNGLTGATQTFATTSATGIGLSIVSTGTTHTFSPTVSSGYSIPLTASTTDWNTAFLNRITSLTTSGTSGAATLSGNTLNIPQYAGTTYLAGTGLTLTTGTFSVNASQSISTLSNLTSNGLIKTSGGTGALSIATAGTDYQAPISLTTTGSSGAATFVGNTLNIPQYAGTTYTATYPVTLTGSAFGLAFGTTTSNTWAGSQTFTNSPVYSTLTAGAVNATSGGTLYSTATTSLSVGSPLTVTGTLGALIGGTNSTINCQTASGSQAGCLASADWTTFNGKQSALTFSYPLVNTGGTISTAFGTTTSNTWAGTQTFTNAPILSSLTGILKGNGASAVTVAAAGTDYLAPAGSGAALTGVVYSVKQNSGTAQTGAITLATTTSTANGLTSSLAITNSTGTFTFAPSLSGILTIAGGGTGLNAIGASSTVLVSNGTTAAWQLPAGGASLFTNSTIYTYLSTGTNLGIGTTTPYSTLSVLDAFGTTTSPFSAWGAASTTVTSTAVFTSNGTWTKPAGLVSAQVITVGAGGAGGGGSGHPGGAGGGSTGFAATTPCVADGGGGGAALIGGGTGGDGQGGAGGTSSGSTGGGGGGSGAEEVCNYTAANLSSTVAVTIGQGGNQSTGGTGYHNGGSISSSGGGQGGGSTSDGQASASTAGGNTANGASTGGTTTNGNNGNGSGNSGGNVGTNSVYTGSGAPAAGVNANVTDYGAGGGSGGFSTGGRGNGAPGVTIVIMQISEPSPFAGITITPTNDGSNNVVPYVGIGTSTPTAMLTVQGTGNKDAFDVWSYVANTVVSLVFAIDKAGHEVFSGGTPTLTACGTNGFGTIVGNDNVMRVTTGGSVSSCTVNFNKAWTNIPICTVTSESGTGVTISEGLSTTQDTINLSASQTNYVLDVRCSGYQ